MRGILKSTILLGTMCAAAAFAADHKSVFALQSRPVKATAEILAVSSSSRQSFAGGQDIYLAQVQTSKSAPEFARLIDDYPGYGLPIREAVLRSRAPLSMSVIRDPGCDLPASEVFLAADSRQVYDASVRGDLQRLRTQSVPCFRTLHNSIHFENTTNQHNQQ